MPYIKEERRSKFRDKACHLGMICENKGDLNYTICMIMWTWLNRKGPPSYDDYSDICGAVTDAVDEFKRRKRDIYEDKKIEENGDIW